VRQSEPLWGFDFVEALSKPGKSRAP